MGESCNAPVFISYYLCYFNRVGFIISSFVLFYCWFYFGNYIIFLDVYILPRSESVCGIIESRGILVISLGKIFSFS